MSSSKYSKKYYLIVGLSCWLLYLKTNIVWAQGNPTVVKGTIKDAHTQEPLVGVSVYYPGSSIGTTTHADGTFLLRSPKPFTTVTISYIGFKTVTRTITPGETNQLTLLLESDAQALNEVKIIAKRGRYKNKGNPAVDLIRLVIDHKNQNRLESYNYVEYQQYEKILFALTNTPQKLQKNFLLKKFPYLINTLDTTTLPGKGMLPFYLQEVISKNYYRQKPEKKKNILQAEKKVDFGEYLDTKGIQDYFKHLYQDVDIYQNNISVVTNQFLSPIADSAPTFYKFYITDTVHTTAGDLIELSFEPRNQTDFLFTGQLYITLDNRYAVAKTELSVGNSININWVRDLNINLDYALGQDGKYHLSKSDLRGSFGVSAKGSGGVYGTRTLHFSNYVVNEARPDSLYQGLAVEPIQPSLSQIQNLNPDYWKNIRPEALLPTEEQTYTNIETLKNDKAFKRTADWMTALLAGYKKAGPYIEIGPLNTFYSFNPVEGFRLRLGGRTTNAFSQKVNLETYGAYGFKDKKLKYYVGGTYSLTDHSIFQFPVRSLRVSYQQETKIPGQELQFIQEDNFLLSFKRGNNKKWLYNKTFNIELLQEYENHLSYRLGLKRWQQSPAGDLSYILNSSESRSLPIKSLTTSEVTAELRWAPHERFYQGKLYRIPYFNQYPIFTLRGAVGIKGLFDGQYSYQSLTLNIFKRVQLSQFGYTDAVAEGGYVFGQAPFPLLDIHRANQSYSYQLLSYNLMNFLEFVSDHYASIALDHTFNGFIFNKIPLIRKTKFREFIAFKALYGSLRKENNPNLTPGLFQLPVDPSSGQPFTYTLNKKPYMEGSVGIGNILKFFRIDLVKRFSYLENPDAPEYGIRGRFKFDF